MAGSLSSQELEISAPELSGRFTDALFGYGLLYLLSAPLVIWIGSQPGLGAWPNWFIILSALVISVPHYGATILRVYDKRHDRSKYAFFAVWISLALTAGFVASLYDARLGSLFLTAYVCWSPWHFAGQNFGVSMLSLRRRGVPIDKTARRLLQGSVTLAYLLALLAIETAGSRADIALGSGDGSVYQVFRLGIPPETAAFGLWAIGVTYLAVTAAALFRLGREGNVRHLGPTAMLLATHSLWYVVPATSIIQLPLVYTAVWISAMHSIQYLWITTYYAKRTGTIRGGYFLWKCLLVGSALSVIPPLLFAPGLLGPYAPLSSAVSIVFFSILNIHHFVLDGAVWKLRDGRVSRVLLRRNTDQIIEAERDSRTSWLRPAVYALGTIALAIPIYVAIEINRAASSDSHSTVESAASRLAFLGSENADVYFVLGQHRNLAGDQEGAKIAYRKALAVDPEHAEVSYRLAALLLNDPARTDEARSLAQFACQAQGYSNAAALIILGRASVAVGSPDAARNAFRKALAVALEQGDQELADISRQWLGRLAPARKPARRRRI